MVFFGAMLFHQPVFLSISLLISQSFVLWSFMVPCFSYNYFFSNATFCQLVFLVPCHFVNLSFNLLVCLVVILSTGLLISLSIWFHVILSTGLLNSSSFCFTSFCQMVFYGATLFHQLVLLSISLLINWSFVIWSFMVPRLSCDGFLVMHLFINLSFWF